ncbi:patatin-like phospholipase [Algoriphagus boseongensis]|uniref:Patatin-like phospholipase n=1 Tax=Algoriphagus boseongensis TaxID=1442587 RepID=A0A4V3D217_9BACT|nr:patatin-like phospholipase family protein [Algoriphagus boseongensis]TDQ16473.1 patatin-like phospholipase [Algoriphagus boseongensis]
MNEKFLYSFPIQLFLLHLRKNLALILVWVILAGIVMENFGVTLGIPFLFLDPEYLHQTSWLSFFLMGVGLAILTMAFHMTTYIMDGRRFKFLAVVPKPFIHFCINNSLFPLFFYLIYTIKFVVFQLDNDLQSDWEVLKYYGGFTLGSLISYTLIFGYFSLTNKDFFVLFAGSVDKRLRKVRLAKVNPLARIKTSKEHEEKVRTYLDVRLKPHTVRPDISRFETMKLLRVFNQNHLNLFLIEVFLIVFVLFLGVFKEKEILQFPAAMSALLLLAILVMLVGALSFWLRSYATITVVVLMILGNYFSNFSILNRPHEAFGLNYEVAPMEYSLEKLDELLHPDTVQKDKTNMIQILENWKAKFPEDELPKLVIVAASGGGQRASLWTFHVLQHIHNLYGGNITQHTQLYTGASGGVIGQAFFREIYFRSQSDSSYDPLDTKYLDEISADNLNPIIFTLLVNDLLIRNQKFEYGGYSHLKDRGYAFEKQLNDNTKRILDKPLSAYREPEYQAQIPLLPVTTLVTNDGRKLVISPHSMSFLGTSILAKTKSDEKKQTIDFLRFFRAHDSENLRFLSALRMCATFPFITPNVQLPSEPVMETMDTGLSDNFGIQDALRFTYVFKEWIAQNTSGVILITIRDSEKNIQIPKSEPLRIFQKIFNPLKNIYSNWDNVQTIQNEVLFNYMTESMPFDLEKVEFEYNPEQVQTSDLSGSQQAMQRASLNWRLTAREKKSILNSIYTPKNQAALTRLSKLFDSNSLPDF